MNSFSRGYTTRSKLIKSLFGIGLIVVSLSNSACFLKNLSISNKTYVKPIVDAINTLDPKKTRFRTDYMVARAIQGQFFKTDFNGELKPAFIESWEVNDNGDQFTFHVRKNVKFHLGQIANADDVVFSFNYLAASDSLISQLFEAITGYDDYISGKSKSLVGIKKIDDYTVSVKLKTRSYIFLLNLADPKVVVLPNLLNHRTNESFFKTPNGIGPYRVSFISKDQSHIELSANENFYDGKPKISKYSLIVMDQETAVQKFINSEVQDLELFTVPISMHKRLQEVGNIFSVTAYSTVILFFNGYRPVFQNLELRQEIGKQIEIEPISKDCDLSVLKASGFIPHGVTGWIDPNLVVLRDRTNGKKPSGKKVSLPTKPLIFLSYGNEINSCIANKVVEQLNRKGKFKVKHLHVEPEEAIRLFTNGNYDFLFDHLSIRGSEPFHLLSYFEMKSPHNLIKFRDPWIDTLIKKIEGTAVNSIRANLYRELDQYITYEKSYMLPLYSDMRHYFFSKNVKGPAVPGVISLNNGFEEIWF